MKFYELNLKKEKKYDSPGLNPSSQRDITTRLAPSYADFSKMCESIEYISNALLSISIFFNNAWALRPILLHKYSIGRVLYRVTNFNILKIY